MPTNREILFRIKMANLAKAALSDFRNDLKAVADQAGKTGAQVDAMAKKVDKAGNAMQKAAGQALAFVKAMQATNNALALAGAGGGKEAQGFQQFSTQINITQQRMQTLIQTAKQVNTSISQINTTNINGMSKGLSSAAEGAQALRAQFGTLTNAVLGFVSATTALKGVEMFAGFERQISNIQAVTGASTQEMKQAENAIRKIGTTSEFSASQAASAFEQFARAGMSVRQASEAAVATLNLALVAQTDLGNASQITSSILNQFGIDVKQTATVVDVLAQVDNTSAASTKSLGESFAYAGAAASAAGVDFNTLAAAFGVLGNAGSTGSRAGTEMQEIITSMVEPTRKATDALKRMGLSAKDLNPADLAGTFKKLHDAALDFEKANAIFETRGARAAIALAQNVAKLKELEDGANSAGGAAQRAADIISNNLTGDLNRLRAVLQDVAIGMGEGGVGAALRSVVQDITGAVRSANELIGSFSSVGDHAGTVKLVLEGLGGAAIAIGTVTAAVYGLSVAFGVLDAAMDANPIGLIAVSVAAAAGALYMLRDTTVEVGDSQIALKDIVTSSWGYVREAIEGTLAQVSGLLSDFASAAPADLKAAFDGMASSSSLSFWQVANDAISMWQSIDVVANGIVRTITEFVQRSVAQLKQLADGFAQLLSGDFKTAGQTLGEALTDGMHTGILKNMDQLGADLKRVWGTDHVGAAVEAVTAGAKDASYDRYEDARNRGILQRIAPGMPALAAAGQVGVNAASSTHIDNPNSTGTGADRLSASEQKFALSQQQAIERLRQQTELLGHSSEEIERMNALLKVKDEAEKAGVENVQKYVDLYMKEWDAAKAAQQAFQSNPMNGFTSAVQKFTTDNMKFADATEKVWSSAFDSIADNFATMVTTGKADWKGMLQSMEQEMIKASFKYLMAQAFQGLGLGGVFGVSGGAVALGAARAS